jgi:DNA-binding XRE family transcriptional regulator
MHGYAGGQYAFSPVATIRSAGHPRGNDVVAPGPSSVRISDGPLFPRVTPSTHVVTDKSVDLLPRDISSRFGLRLRELRRSRQMTQLRMAVDFGIDRSFISDVERGRKSISLHMLEVIALGMNLTLSDLLDGI